MLTGLISLAASTALAETDPTQELKRLHQQLSASNSRQEEISGRLNLLSGEIRALKEKSAQIALRLNGIDQKMVETEERLEDIAAVESQTLQMLSRQNKGLANTLSALLQLSRQPEGSLIGSPENLVDTLRAATLLKSVIPSLKDQAEELSTQLDTLAGLRDEYLQEQQKLATLRTSRQTEQAALNELLEAKQMVQAALKSRNVREEKKQASLNAKAQDLVALLSRLEKEKQARLAAERRRIEAEIKKQEELRKLEQERKAKELALAKEEKNSQVATAPIPKPIPTRKETVEDKPVVTASLPKIQTGEPFSKIKGTLPLPVGGKIVSKYNSSPERLKKNGIVIETRDGATVISPYDGQIAFAGPFRHYGLLLIIDHGEGYHTLLAGLGSIDGEVGQLLLAGEPVGTMNAGNRVNPTLYMELRVKGSPINPIPWLAAGYRKVSG